jgi:hypothetical protein
MTPTSDVAAPGHGSRNGADAALLPHFIIGGAPRSGTTFLCHALDRHPGIYLAKPYVPEPKVFVGPAGATVDYRARYHALFAAAGDRRRGEKTTLYFESAEACRRLRAALPHARILFLVREPVARAYSNYLWSTKNGLETLPFEEAVALEGRRDNPLGPEKAYARPFDYLLRGGYAAYARCYYAAFGRDAVGFFLQEELARQPERVLRRIQEFVGVEPRALDLHGLDLVNSAREAGPPIHPATEARLRERMRPEVERFAAVTGLDLGAWGY